MTTFALVLYVAGHVFIIDTGLSADDCERALMRAPHDPIACEAQYAR